MIRHRAMIIYLKALIYEGFFFDMQKIGLKHAAYYRKLRLKTFTHQEVKLITTLLYPEEILAQELQKSEEDINLPT